VGLCCVRRAKEPWEGSDGAVYLVRELATVAPTAAVEFIPQLADLARLSTFQHAYNMHETIWRSLPTIAQCVGIKEFKQQYLELFLQPLFADLRCGHQLAEAEAGECISKLRDLIGARIFAGRLDDLQKAALESDSNILPSKSINTSSCMDSVTSAAAGGSRQQMAGVAGGIAPQFLKQAWG